jgi:hypothetical protein
METPHQLRRLPTAETLESMTNEESSRLGDDHDQDDNRHQAAEDSTAGSSTPAADGGATAGNQQLRRRRPLMESLNAKRRQVQHQQRLRGKKRSFVEDFYRVDKIESLKQRPANKPSSAAETDKRFKVILPGLPAYEPTGRVIHTTFSISSSWYRSWYSTRSIGIGRFCCPNRPC